VKFQMGFIKAGAAAPPTITTWNPADKSAAISLSGGNLTASHPAVGFADGIVRSTTSKSSGKWHFEVTVNATGPTRPGIGLANSTQSLTTFLGAAGSNSVSLFGNGDVYINAVVVLAGATGSFDTGLPKVIAVEYDADNDLVFFQLSGGPRTAGISTAALGGTLFAAYNNAYFGDAATGNFGASAFVISPTLGFSAWG
jgi:hypothetical protein